MTPADLRQLARLVFRDPRRVYERLLAEADKQAGYECKLCGQAAADLMGLQSHVEAQHGRGLDGRPTLRVVR